MKIGINLLLWTTEAGEAHFPLLADLKRMGYDGVEFPIFTPDDARYRRVRAELDNLGLECTTVAVMTAEANPISPEAGVRREAAELLKRAIETTHLLGGKVLCGPLHSALGVQAGRGRAAEEWGRCAETLRAVAPFAEAAGVTLALEPLNRFESYFLNIAEDAAALAAEVAHPNVRAMYDTFHANIEERSITDALHAVAPALAHFHISENHRGTPGTGLVGWQETFAALREVGYDSWLTIEAFGRALPEIAAATCIWRDLFDSPEQLARQGLAFIRDSLK